MALQQLQIDSRVDTKDNVHPLSSRLLSSVDINHDDNCRACDTRNGCLALQLVDDDVPISDNRHIYHRGEHVFYEGDTADTIYVVRSGSVKTYLITEDGEEQVFGFYMAGDVLGLEGIGERGRQLSAQALETTSLCKLPAIQFAASNHGHGLLELVSEQMARNYNLVLLLAKKDADARIASLLCDLSQRFERHGYAADSFNLSMSRIDIGSYLGLAIETVSRTFRRLQEAGVLNVERRKIEIKDESKLQAIAGYMVSHDFST